jgi:hypothetical protein
MLWHIIKIQNNILPIVKYDSIRLISIQHQRF